MDHMAKTQLTVEGNTGPQCKWEEGIYLSLFSQLYDPILHVISITVHLHLSSGLCERALITTVI